jgi:uncharacterized protein (DUF697 family)
MPLGIGIGQLFGLVRETRALESATGWIAVSGPGAPQLATRLAVGGDPTAIRVDGDPLQALVAIRLLDDGPSVGEIAALRRIARAGTPLVVVARHPTGAIPYVAPHDVIVADTEPPIAALASVIARVASDTGPALAARLPLLRPAVTRRLISTTALTNAAIAASPFMKQAQLPVLTLAQGRMLLLLGVAQGAVLPRDPQQLAIAAGPALAGPFGLGIAARELVRRMPLRGPLVRAAVAYAGTRALGAARSRL